jgi:hypothetical protein
MMVINVNNGVIIDALGESNDYYVVYAQYTVKMETSKTFSVAFFEKRGVTVTVCIVFTHSRVVT